MDIDIDWDVVDLAGYPEYLQLHIRKMLKDPCSVPSRLVDDVVDAVVTRSYKDPEYYQSTAAICQHIIEREHQEQCSFSIPKYYFRVQLIDKCQLLLKDWHKLRTTSIQMWIQFCRFIGEMYKKVCVERIIPIVAFRELLINVMIRLTRKPCAQNPDELDLLCSLFCDHGASITQSCPSDGEELIKVIRDEYLSANTDLKTQRHLLMLIEMYASDFSLSDDAKCCYNET